VSSEVVLQPLGEYFVYHNHPPPLGFGGTIPTEHTACHDSETAANEIHGYSEPDRFGRAGAGPEAEADEHVVVWVVKAKAFLDAITFLLGERIDFTAGVIIGREPTDEVRIVEAMQVTDGITGQLRISEKATDCAVSYAVRCRRAEPVFHATLLQFQQVSGGHLVNAL
jgi:hypothetical protein